MLSLVLAFFLTPPLFAQSLSVPEPSAAPDISPLIVPGEASLSQASALPLGSGLPALPTPLAQLPPLAPLSALPSGPAPRRASSRPATAVLSTQKRPLGQGLASFIRKLAAPALPAALAYEAGRNYYDLGGLRANETGPGPVFEPEDPHRSLPPAGITRFVPRVIFLQDVADQPLSAQAIAYIDRALDLGVHVVFLTWRPVRGPHSAEDFLLGKLKNRRVNPLMVVSYNGGKISLNSEAKEPASIIPDTEGLPTRHLLALQRISARVQAKLKIQAVETVYPNSKNPFIYSIQLGEDLPIGREKVLREFNRDLRQAKLPYRMSSHPNDPRILLTHSMPLRFSIERVMQALDLQFRGEDLLRSPEKFLVLTDSKRSPRFTGSFPKGAYSHVVKNSQDIEEAFGAALGEKALPTFSVLLSELRQFVEYWEPTHRFSAVERYEGAGGGGARLGRSKDREFDQKFAMYVGGVIYSLETDLYEKIWRGKHWLATLNQVLARLRRIWPQPARYGVRVSKQQAKLMRDPLWKVMSPGYLRYAESYVSAVYLRELGDYPSAAQDIMDHQLGLSTDRKSLITLKFVSPLTGRLYLIHTRIPRGMWHDTAEGRELTAYAWRTGKETPDDGEELYAKILAMALLIGHGRRGPDGLWHHGAPDGPVIAKLNVQLEYRSSHRTWTFSPDEFYSLPEKGVMTQGPIVQQITSTIERMRADEAFLTYSKENKEKADPKDLKKPRPVRKKKKTPAVRPKPTSQRRPGPKRGPGRNKK